MKSPPTWWSLRIAYLEDFVYKQRFQDEYKDAELGHSKTFSKLSTDAAQVTLNFKNRIDLYGIFGSSKIQLDNEVYTSRRFSWGTGFKLVLFHAGKFRIGTDIKYFETEQKPVYFISDDLAFNVRSNFILQYYEIQGTLGASYRIGPVIPYVYATYLYTKIDPKPPKVLVRLPMMDLEADMVMKSVIGQRRWGVSAGATLLDCKMGTLTVESRFFNQNSIDVNLEVRF